jgi:hypothetical protein
MSTESDKAILEARKKMQEQFKDLKLGGKGIFYTILLYRKSKKNQTSCS